MVQRIKIAGRIVPNSKGRAVINIPKEDYPKIEHMMGRRITAIIEDIGV